MYIKSFLFSLAIGCTLYTIVVLCTSCTFLDQHRISRSVHSNVGTRSYRHWIDHYTARRNCSNTHSFTACNQRQSAQMTMHIIYINIYVYILMKSLHTSSSVASMLPFPSCTCTMFVTWQQTMCVYALAWRKTHDKYCCSCFQY